MKILNKRFFENNLVENIILDKFSQVIKKSQFIFGEELDTFEKDYAHFCNVDYAIGTSSGSSALYLALKSLNLTKNDEVIVPVFTFISTALAVYHAGAKIIFCDINPDTFNIDIEKIEALVNRNTKAIIAVHMYGQMADMENILKISTRHNLMVIEDAAQAHGATTLIKGVPRISGSVGDIGCFSFYPTKNLGAFGDAGMVTTNNKSTQDFIRSYLNYGQMEKNIHDIIGFNERMDNIQAIVLSEKLIFLNEWNERRANAAKLYTELLTSSKCQIPKIGNNCSRHVYHQFVVKVERRDFVFKYLKDHSVDVAIQYPIPLHLQKCFHFLNYKKGDFSNAENVCSEIISLPMFPFIETVDIEKTVDFINRANVS